MNKYFYLYYGLYYGCCCFRFRITTNFQRIPWMITTSLCKENFQAREDRAMFIKINTYVMYLCIYLCNYI